MKAIRCSVLFPFLQGNLMNILNGASGLVVPHRGFAFRSSGHFLARADTALASTKAPKVTASTPQQEVVDRSSSSSLQSSLQAQAEDCLAQSLLCFMWAQFRLLSAEGRVITKFENLAVVSDNAVKNTADRWAAKVDAFGKQLSSEKEEGISPAQIMATLLLEMRKAEREYRQQQKIQGKDGPEMSLFDTIFWDSVADPAERTVTDNMEVMLLSYISQLARDLQGAPDLDGLQEASEAYEQAVKRGGISIAISGSSSAAPPKADALEQFSKVSDQIFDMIRKELPVAENVSEDDLLDYMQEIVDSREYDRLDFMSRFFKKDSVSELAVKSKSRFVWINDWHPYSDVLYAVSVDKDKKVVTVTFRGLMNWADFITCTDSDLIDVPNPVKQDYPGKTEHIQMHSGFYKYLFRPRKDTGTCKFDEIVSIVDECASRIGKDYRVVVTGLSLGGALATVFSLFASVNELFTNNGPLQAYSFGSPYTAGGTGADCFHFQEVSRKLQHARFCNVRDVIAHWPPNYNADYKHMGLKFKLHRPRPQSQWKELAPVRRPEVAYDYIPSNERKFDQLVLAWKELAWFNLPLPANLLNVHLLPEHQRRALLARAVVQKENPNDTSTLDDLYEEFVYSKYNP